MEESRKQINGKPLQMLSWSEKQAKDKEYFKNTANYYISQGVNGRNSLDGGLRGELKTFYDVYNNQIPTKWFDHVTDPLSAKDPKHKSFPAKIRPTNILRTNIDQLLSEWMRRPFKYRVENIGEDGYNRYTEELNKALTENITQHFLAEFAQQLIAQGASEEDIQNIDPASIPLPQEVKDKFQGSYKDKIAVQAQKWLQRALQEFKIKRILHKSFKDWIIAGEGASYKGIHNGELIYNRLSPLYLNFDKSPDTDFVEDGEWATYTYYMTASDIVDLFYHDLTETELKTLERQASTKSPSAFYSYLEGLYTENSNKIPVHSVFWKGRKKVLFIEYIDPVTGKLEKDYADESEEQTLRQQYGQDIKIKIEWVNEVYETWRIGDDIYLRMQPVASQRNSMNNISKTKLPINGKKYSDTHSQNISIVQIGIPYLIMYMIVTRALELMIAKNKGKILMMDNNAIPRTKGWNEERFFYYSEAMGYGLLDRNQLGVDKSWNQYHVVDLSMYEQIAQLIELQNHFKKEWDDVLGFNDARKGQTYAEDSGTKVQQNIFQSSVITDMIFIGFDEYVERELQGLIDLSKFTNINGVRALYNSDIVRDTILEIDPNEYINADLGVFIVDGLEDSDVMNAMKSQVGNMLQNGIRLSTVLEVLQEGNISGLKVKLKAIEAIEDAMAQAEAQQEQQAQADIDERKMAFMEYEKVLEEQLINAEYDRKDDLELIKGENNILSYGQGADEDKDGTPDSIELLKAQSAREKLRSEEFRHARDLDVKERLEKLKEVLSLRDKEAERQSKERISDKQIAAKLKGDKIKAAAMKAKARTKPKTAK